MRKLQLCKKCKDLYKKCKGVYSFSSLMIGISFHYARSNKPLVSEPSVGAVFPQKLSTLSTLFSLTKLFIGERARKPCFLQEFLVSLDRKDDRRDNRQQVVSRLNENSECG